ncbi:type II secretion system F family protein [Nonomuraea sp. NPDC050556]|uniref:type II secretion system F family protein n=1 Tax=Nonomuraea sp. NPDC050556 TaxID=3364369 RepID=UPI0037B062B7
MNNMLMATIGGGFFVAGLFLLAMFVRGTEVRPKAGNDVDRKEQLRKLAAKLGLAVVVGAVVLVLTRWPVIAVGSGLLVIGWNGIAGGAAEERLAMKNLEALAAWTESLRDTIAGAAGLEQAIPASIRAAAPTLQPHIRAMVDRLHTRMSLSDALHRFADDIGDPSADLVIAALILNSKLRGPGLREVLSALAGSAREELDVRTKVEAERRSTRRSVQIVVGASVGFAAILVIFNPSYVQEYSGWMGQVVLLVVALLFGAGFAWMRRLAKFTKPERLLARVTPVDTEAVPR